MDIALLCFETMVCYICATNCICVIIIYFGVYERVLMFYSASIAKVHWRRICSREITRCWQLKVISWTGGTIHWLHTTPLIGIPHSTDRLSSWFSFQITSFTGQDLQQFFNNPNNRFVWSYKYLSIYWQIFVHFLEFPFCQWSRKFDSVQSELLINLIEDFSIRC